MIKRHIARAAVLALATAALNAHAAIDTTDISAALADLLTIVTLIGGGLVAAAAAAIAFKWAKAALFGG